MSTFLYGGQTWTLQSSISSTATTITLSSFLEPVSGVPVTMALMNSTIAYGTLAPKTTSSEFISFTGITQNANGTATLTGVTRGLKRGYDYTSSATFMLPHSGGSNFILSDLPQALVAANIATQIGGSNQQLQYNNNGVFGGVTGTSYSGTNLTITTGVAGFLILDRPRILTSIQDANNNPIIGLTPVASANRYITITNSNGGTPIINTSGGTVDMLIGGSTGYLRISGDGTGSTSDNLTLTVSGGSDPELTPGTTNKNLRLSGSGTGVVITKVKHQLGAGTASDGSTDGVLIIKTYGGTTGTNNLNGAALPGTRDYYLPDNAGTLASIDQTVSFNGALKTKSPTLGLGYATGAGGSVTQATSRTTGVTLNKVTGAITLVSAAGSTTPATFTVSNTTVVATDTIIVNQKSGTDLYTIDVTNVTANAFNITFNTKSGTTVEQPVFNFAIIKAVIT